MVVKELDKYYHNTLFAFLPNICNSACDFCYVSPIKGKTAKLSKRMIANFATLVEQAKKNGINTVRITGGEPLIFQNFNSLIEILLKKNINYTIITNGQELNNHIKNIKLFPPKKINISFHSFKNYETIFKNKINLVSFFKALEVLQKIGVLISITIVYQEINKDEINEMINIFEKKEFNEIKIIYPNIKSNKSLENRFKSEFFQSSSIDIRYTDFEQTKCLLQNRGFLSIIIENLKSYNCCTTIGENENQTLINDEFSLKKIMEMQYKDNMKITNFPCKSYISCCPISLKIAKKAHNKM